MIRCQKCGYTNQSSAKKCIKCYNTLQEDMGDNKRSDTSVGVNINKNPWGNDSNDTQKTMRRVIPSSKPCYLVALSQENEEESKMLPVKGENINLNREFLDEGNTSISRKGHANLMFKDGSWWIDNVSELKTTFVQVNKPVKLSDGDVVLIGDSLFKFKENSQG